jgi:hypothetical protein
MNEDKYRQIIFSNKWNLEQSRQSIGETYPNVDLIKIKFEFTYFGVILKKKMMEKIFYRHDKEFFQVDCINLNCINSDLNLSNEINNMIKIRETTLLGEKTCHGYQNFQRYKTNGNSCLTKMKFQIDIKYI